LSGARDIASRPPLGRPSAQSARFKTEWVTRPFFGVVLAGIAVALTAAGAYPFSIMVAVVSAAALREWHRIVEEGGFARELWISAPFLSAALILMAARPGSFLPWLVLAAGTALVFMAASMRGARALWHASGVLYVGVPALLLSEIRATVPHAPWVIIGLFLIVWATDTGALVCGNLIGGPKLLTSLSPKKTWAGAIGGTIAACVAMGAYVAAIGGNVPASILLAAVLSVAAHAGDLSESWVKRQFKVKDSGGLIPGHGGALDRIDSTLAASVALAAAVLGVGIDATFGAPL